MESLYYEFRRDAIHKIRNIMNNYDLAKLEEQVRQDLQEEGIHKFGLKTQVYFKTNNILAERNHIPDYESWKKQMKQKVRAIA